MLRRVITAALLVTLMAGCKGRDRVIARADGVTVTERELRQALWERYGAVVLHDLLTHRLVEREALRRGVAVTDTEVQTALRRQRLPDTPAARERMRSALLLQKLAEAMAQVSKAEAQRYFERHRAEFERPERVRLRDITLESRENAQAIWEALRLRRGTNFADLARHFSTNPVTRLRGGDMGVVPVRELHPKLQTVVRTLRVGEFSRPVQLDGEWVIVKLEERLPAERPTFGAVRTQVIARLRRQKALQLQLTLPERLWRQAKVQVLDPSLHLTAPSNAPTQSKGVDRR